MTSTDDASETARSVVGARGQAQSAPELRVAERASEGVVMVDGDDVSERKRSQSLAAGQQRVLELVATGAPLRECLDELMRVIEAQTPGMLCSVLLLDRDGKHLRHGGAPSLPEGYCRAIDGAEIGPRAGSCGTALFRREPVIVGDIARDPLWADYRELALSSELRACWSTPIFDRARQVLGSFAIYYRMPALPSDRHRHLIEVATHMAAIAIGRDRVETALRVTESRYRRLLDSNIVGVFIADFDGRIKEANQEFLRMLGRERADLEAGALRWDELTPPEFTALDRRNLQLLAESGVCPAFEKQLLHRDGHPIAVRIMAAMLEGSPEECLCLIEDISQRKRVERELRASEARLAEAQAHAKLGVWERDPERWTGHWSPEMFRLYGLQPSAAAPGFEEFIALLHPDDRAKMLDYLRDSARSETAHTLEYRTDPARGPMRYLSASAHPVLDAEGRVVRLVGTVLDVTERTEKELIRAKNIELSERNRMAQEANRLKNEFLANMSHELRTPLNAIIGFSEFLVDQKPGPLNPRQSEYLNDILDSGRHLLRLINDILDLAKVEAGKLELSPQQFALGRAVEEACAIVRPLADKREIALELAVEPRLGEVYLDQGKLKQVLFNLLSNAIKFSHAGGRVTIEARRFDDERFELRVSDRGVGIRREDFPKLFQEFQQLDSGAAREREGTGLGLRLTKRIVECQNGTIGVESEYGRGSTFFVVLPRTSP